MKILIVEDEWLIQEGYKAMLSDGDFEIVAVAGDAGEAIEIFKRLHDQIDLAIVDINIPEMDGIEVIEQFNQYCQIPCVIVTGYCDEVLIKRASNAGVFGYLQKPVDRYDLLSAISVAQERFQKLHQLQIEVVNSQKALEDRKVIERAKGILMDKFEIKECDAMKFLQKKSKDRNKKLAEIAREIIRAEQLLNI